MVTHLFEVCLILTHNEMSIRVTWLITLGGGTDGGCSFIHSFIHSLHWHVQNVTIPCHSQELLPFLSVIYFLRLQVGVKETSQGHSCRLEVGSIH
jgi:hypothetical protein